MSDPNLETELKQAQEALKEWETKFRALTEAATCAIYICQGQKTCYVNPAATAISGYTQAELLKMNFLNIVHPDFQEIVRARGLARQQGESVPERYEVKFITKSGEERWAEINATLIEFKGRPAKLGITFDITEYKQNESALLRAQVAEAINKQLEKQITERKRVELALRESEERYRRLVDLCPDTVFVQSEGKFVLINSAGAKLLGAVNPRKLIGKRVLDFVHPDYREIVTSQMRQPTEEANEVPLVEQKLLRLDGTVVDVEAAAAPFSYEGKPATQVVIRDITKRKQAELLLQQLNSNLEHQVQERTAQLQQALDFEAMLKRITDKVRDSLDESQILQTAVQELTLVLSLSGCNAALYNLSQGTSTIYYECVTNIPASQGRAAQMANFPEIYHQLLKGQYFQFCSIFPNPLRGHVAMLACPIMNHQGVLGDLWLINQKDYTFNDLEIRLVQQVANQCAIAIRQARLYQAATAQVKELEKLNQLKDDFLSTVSHELRTPISNMKVAIRMLQTAPTSERHESYLKILQAECDREAELINTLLDLQQLEAASYSISLETISLQDWLPSIIEPFQLRTQQRQQLLHVELPLVLLPIISDRASLGRVLAELLNNAYKYTPSSGEIVLSVRQDSNRAAGISYPLAVSHKEETVTTFILSNQADIAAEELPRIFEKLYRIPNADPWQQGGTGLGLALVQKLVEQLQGNIQVDSSRGWTTFTVYLPNQPKTENDLELSEESVVDRGGTLNKSDPESQYP